MTHISVSYQASPSDPLNCWDERIQDPSVGFWFQESTHRLFFCWMMEFLPLQTSPPPSITADAVVQILTSRWMFSLSLDPLRFVTFHTTRNETITVHTWMDLYEPLWVWRKTISCCFFFWCFNLAAFLLRRSRIGSDERQFVGEKQVVGLIVRDAGWKESVSLRVECLLHWWSSSPDKEQQQAYCHLPPRPS